MGFSSVTYTSSVTGKRGTDLSACGHLRSRELGKRVEVDGVNTVADDGSDSLKKNDYG